MLKKVQIYFMSGTGNSYQAATWLEKMAQQNGLETRLSSVSPTSPVQAPGNDSLLALFFPTHGFTAPWNVIRFAWRLPRVSRVPAIVVATRATMRFGRIFTPGISGSATFLIALLLWLKGFRVPGIHSLDMPSNWLTLHPGMANESYEMINQRAEPRLAAFTKKMLQGQTSWFTWNNLYETTWMILLCWISLLYLLLGRFFLSKIFFANLNCNLCGVCVQNCPVSAIKIVGHRLIWRYNCESCMRCMAFCPRNAVEAGHSWAVILYIFISTSILSWLLNFVGLSYIFAPQNFWLQWSLFIANFYLSLCIAYFIFNRLIQIPFCNRIFSLTTFTRLYRRSHQLGIKIQDLVKPEN